MSSKFVVRDSHAENVVYNVYYNHQQYDMLRQLFDLFTSRSKDMLVIKKK